MYRMAKMAVSMVGVVALLMGGDIRSSDASARYLVARLQAHGGATPTLDWAGTLDSRYWNTGITSLPITLNYPAVARGHDGNIYVFGGSDTQTYDTTYIYHPSSNTWTRGAPMLAPRTTAQAVTLPDGRIAVIGGNSGCNTCVYNTTFIYTPRTNSWIEAAPMISARQRFGAVLGRDGRVYAIGGWDGVRALPTVETYDPVHNVWAPAAGLPVAEEGIAAATDRKGDIIVLGGFNGQEQASYTFYSNAYMYIRSGWKSIAAMPTPREDFAAVLGSDGRIYAIGGFNNQQGIATVEAYDPTTDSWSSVIELPSPRCCLSAALGPAGHIFVFGGAGAQVAVLESEPSQSAPSPQSQLTVVAPGPNAVVTDAVLRFAWKSYPRAAYYNLQIWLVQAAKGQAIRVSSVTNFAIRLKGTSYALNVKVMPKGVYQWRMAATNVQGTLISPWSSVKAFTIAKA